MYDDRYYPIEISQDTAERIIGWKIVIDALCYLVERSQSPGCDESAAIILISRRITQLEASIVPSISGSLTHLIDSGKIEDPLESAERNPE